MNLQPLPEPRPWADNFRDLIPLTDLPVEDIVDDLRGALASHATAVLVAPPGAGKSTLIPLRLITESWMENQRIVMLEPRRLAARATARRLATLLDQEPGDFVGYQTRDERIIGKNTRIEVVTEGILTRRLQSDPSLPGVGLVIFDEVHERHLPTDLGLALCLDVRRTLRPDLRILAMSATAEATKLSALLGHRQPAPVIESHGRQHPVDIIWAPPNKGARLIESTVDVVLRALREQDGDILVFLPGIGEIRRAQSLIESSLPTALANGVDVFPLAGSLALVDQDRALAPSRLGSRRVVLSTDIAETSLTVAGVRVVVDAGSARVPLHDPRTGMTRLVTIPTSRASAEQRSGRAGRQSPGVAYRMWNKLEHGSRRAHLDSEINRVDLAGLALEIAQWGTPLADLLFIDPPPEASFQRAQSLLHMLGALDDQGRITTTGRKILSVPVHPRLAHMMTSTSTSKQSLACLVAALLDERDVLRGRPDDLPADIGYRIDVITGRIHDERADHRAVEGVRQRARDLARRSNISFDEDGIDSRETGSVLLLAYPDRLAIRRQPGQFQLRTGSAAWCPPKDSLGPEPFIVAADLDGDRKNARIRMAATVDESTIMQILQRNVVEERVVTWDRDRQDFAERVIRRIDKMRLSEITKRPDPGEQTTAVILDYLIRNRLTHLPWTSKSQQLRSRVTYLHRVIGEPWPQWSDKELINSSSEWLAPFLIGMCSIEDVRSLDMAVILRSMLPWPIGSDLDELAPTHFVTPSKKTVSIDYEHALDDGAAPIVRIRVQDLFGLATHPTILGGRVPLVLHLLSPADRPIQITADLPNFWRGSWSEVRKDMAGRYPKHQWPVDPATAEPKRLKD